MGDIVGVSWGQHEVLCQVARNLHMECALGKCDVGNNGPCVLPGGKKLKGVGDSRWGDECQLERTQFFRHWGSMGGT
jgi:hypothetical protein